MTVDQSLGNPYAGDPKVQVNPRIHRGLWQRYEELVEEVRRSGGRATLTDMVNAILHFNMPPDPREAQRMLNRYRAMLAVDPEE